MALATALAAFAAPGEGDSLAEAADQVILRWRHPADGVSLVARGRTRAEPVAGGWRLVLPPLEWIRPTQERLRLAGATVTLQPVDAERVRLQLHLPTAVPILDKEGLSLGQVTLGRQRIEATWERRADWLTQLEVRIDRVTGRDKHQHETFHLGTLHLAARLDERAGGTWGGAWSVDVSDLATPALRLPAAAA
jgi:hypothetical protein